MPRIFIVFLPTINDSPTQSQWTVQVFILLHQPCCITLERNLRRKHPVEDDDSLTIKEKRHSRVKSWTKKVDIFEKDYLVIPINERNHWFLAIVCFPWLSGPVTAIDNQPIKLRPQQTYSKKTTDQQRKFVAVNGESFHIGNTTVTPVNSKSKVLMSAFFSLNESTW